MKDIFLLGDSVSDPEVEPLLVAFSVGVYLHVAVVVSGVDPVSM